MSVPAPRRPRNGGGRWEVIQFALESWARTFRLCLILLVTIVSPVAAAVVAVLIHHVVLRGSSSPAHRPALMAPLGSAPPPLSLVPATSAQARLSGPVVARAWRPLGRIWCASGRCCPDGDEALGVACVNGVPQPMTAGLVAQRPASRAGSKPISSLGRCPIRPLATLAAGSASRSWAAGSRIHLGAKVTSPPCMALFFAARSLPLL